MKNNKNTHQEHSVYVLDFMNTAQITYWDQFKNHNNK